LAYKDETEPTIASFLFLICCITPASISQSFAVSA